MRDILPLSVLYCHTEFSSVVAYMKTNVTPDARLPLGLVLLTLRHTVLCEDHDL